MSDLLGTQPKAPSLSDRWGPVALYLLKRLLSGGLVLLAGITLAILDSARDALRHRRAGIAAGPAVETPEGADPDMPWWKIALFLALGLVGLPIGANLLIDSATEIAAMFGVPAHLAGAPSSDSLTYSTVAEDSRAFVRFGLRAWVHRLEAALSSALPRGQSASFATAEFLQPDIKTRYEAAQIAIAAGFKTIDEVRAEEGLPA